MLDFFRKEGDDEEEGVISPEVLALVSAELAAEDQGLTAHPHTGWGLGQAGKGLAALLYNEFSDEGDDGTSVSHTSMEELDTEDSDIIGPRHVVTGHMTTRDADSARAPQTTRDTTADHVAARLPAAAAAVQDKVVKSQPAAALGDNEAPGKRKAAPGRRATASSEDLEARGRIVSASVTSLSSQFGQSAAALENDIARSVGLEQLTRLSRATSARVVVDSLQVDPSAVNTIMAHNTSKKKSVLPCSAALRYM